MKILIVNTTDSGGAANSCVRLHLGLLQQGVDSKLLVLERFRDIPQTFVYKKPYVRKTRWQRLLIKIAHILGIKPKNRDREKTHKEAYLEQRPKGLEMFSFPDSEYDITNSIHYREADVVNLHWVAGFLNYAQFFSKNTKPVVWTLHDMNPFSGGDHFNEIYLGIDKNGNPIERKLTTLETKTMHAIEVVKQKAVATVNKLIVVAPSRWLAQEASQSKVFANRDVLHIPYGLNTAVFKPWNKAEVRRELGIPAEKTVLLFVAESMANQRKGFVYLERALAHLNNSEVVLCSVGLHAHDISGQTPLIQLGRIEDPTTMSKAYAAADAFIIPSLMDNLPNTVLEALMCGTPVLGFPTGGIVDMVLPGQNGNLTTTISVKDLRSVIDRFIDNPKEFDSEKIRHEAVIKYGLEVQAKRYKQLFANLITPSD